MIFFLARPKKNTTGVSYGAETVYPSGAPDFTTGVSGVSVLLDH
jgi:hypothetical protein